MKYVWQAYKLALVFESPVSIFYAKPSTTFDGKFFGAFGSSNTLQNDYELLDFPPPHQPHFSVKPGFVVQDCIIKTQLYLIAKSGSEYHKQVFLYTGLIFPFIQFHSFMRKVTNQSFVKILLIKADRISSHLASQDRRGILEAKEAKLTGPFLIKGLKVLVDYGDSQ
jgi:hypothetical protein